MLFYVLIHFAINMTYNDIHKCFYDFMICCENFLPSKGNKAVVYPIPVSTNNIAKYNFTKVHPGEPMSLLRLFTEHEHG